MLCGLPRKEAVPDNLSVTEKKAAGHENDFFLSGVKYSTFRDAIKKYGSNGNLNENHISEISGVIGAEPKDITTNKETETYLVFVIIFLLTIRYLNFAQTDKDYGYAAPNWVPSKLLTIGFLYCIKGDSKDHLTELWHIAQPDGTDKVAKKNVIDVVEGLFYIAVDQRIGKQYYNLNSYINYTLIQKLSTQEK